MSQADSDDREQLARTPPAPDPAAGGVPVAGGGWSEIVESWLLSPHNREARLTEMPALNPLQQRLLADLRERGVAHVAFEDLVDDPSQWRVMAQEIDAWLRTPEVRQAEAAFRATDRRKRRKDDYLLRHYRRQGRQVTLPWTSPWLQVALERRILDLVNHYFTLMSQVYHIDLWVTFADSHEGPRIAAQNWHRDKADIRLVKAFLYFTDVDLESGALQYVPCSRGGDDRFGAVGRDTPNESGYASSADIDRRIPETEWVTCAHPAGTLVLVDTTGLHRGGRAVNRNRVFATWAYGSQTVSHTTFLVDPDGVPGDLPAAARFAFRSGRLAADPNAPTRSAARAIDRFSAIAATDRQPSRRG